MEYTALKKIQEDLDKKKTICPKCKKEVFWWEVRKTGTCLSCYLTFTKN